MRNFIKRLIRPAFQRIGFDVIRREKKRPQLCYPPDFDSEAIEICEQTKPFTMTGELRIKSLIEAVRYIEKNNIAGAFVECGVWRGGSSMAMAITLRRLAAIERDLYLYDTFSGMSAPSGADVSISGLAASQKFSETKLAGDTSDWCHSPLEEVEKNMRSTDYSMHKIHFVVGKVEETIPATMPGKIALLRLDTDWYESTKHELTHLFPLLESGGVLIIDDYGHWKGAKKAVDEYITENNISILLNRIDYTGRIAVKT